MRFIINITCIMLILHILYLLQILQHIIQLLSFHLLHLCHHHIIPNHLCSPFRWLIHKYVLITLLCWGKDLINFIRVVVLNAVVQGPINRIRTFLLIHLHLMRCKNILHWQYYNISMFSTFVRREMMYCSSRLTKKGDIFILCSCSMCSSRRWSIKTFWYSNSRLFISRN